MLFNSIEFLIFLPIVLLGFFALANFRTYYADIWLIVSSLFFYGWWNPKYLALIIPLLLINYLFGLWILKFRNKALLFLGVTFNLLVLGYFKYANFFIDNINEAASTNIYLAKIILPLGISFFTFQKIAYLIDAYRGEVKEHKFLKFSLFVLFFPQLIAGPIVHHKEVIPQFQDKKIYKFKLENLSVGWTIFIIGLFKKLVLADNMGSYASPVFDTAAAGTHLTFLQAWSGALAYTIQLYFDFSGYSDMAIGVARMFGITLPVNFNSPYKSFNIIEFWRRWHMSLSRFLRDYIYIPLGGNREGQGRRYINLAVTMLLAGIWHGAGWTFIIWGMLHGAMLIANHSWHFICRKIKFNIFTMRFGYVPAALITFLSVTICWVIFRAENLHTAFSMLSSMFAMKAEVTIASKHLIKWHGFRIWLLCSLAIIWLMPNTQDFMRNYKPVLKQENNRLLIGGLIWQPVTKWALVMALVTAASLVSMALMQKSKFLYFDF